MSRPVKKKKVDTAAAQTAAALAKERERKNRQTAYIIVGLVLAVILTIFGVFYYQNSVAPFRQVVITVDDVEIRMDYFLQRTRLAGSDAMNMLQSLTNEILIKLGAPRYGISVTAQDIDHELRRAAVGGSDNVTITEAEFKEWYRQQLNETNLSDARFRELVGTSLLAARLQEYVAALTPTVVEQVHLHLIAVQTYEEAVKVSERLKAGENFAAVAREVSLDSESKEKGGDIGWLPRGVSLFDNTVFSLNIGEASEPLPYSEDVSSPPSAYYIIMVSEKADARQVDELYIPALKAQALQNWLNEETQQHTIKFNFNSEIYAWINYQLAKTQSSSSSEQ